jgi:signal recognition particle receptor subunit beta
MVQINFALREVNCKIVFYGPGMSGKTTNLEIVHKKAPEQNKGELTSIATEGDRTLFFDFMPLDLGNVAGMRTKFQLYTVPGQVYYNSTRKLVLQGADGIIFVADSSRSKLKENIESWNNLEENLREYGKSLKDVPVVIQWNKRDLPDAMDRQELEEKLNPLKVPTFEAVAITGEGVFPTLKALSALVLESLNRGTPDKTPGAQDAEAAPVLAGARAAPPKAAASPAAAPPGRRAGAPKVGTRPIGGSTAAPAGASAPAAGGATVPPDHAARRPVASRSSRQAPDMRAGRGLPSSGGRPQPARPRPKPVPSRPVKPIQEKSSNAVLLVVVFLVLAAAAAAVYYFRGELGLM